MSRGPVIAVLVAALLAAGAAGLAWRPGFLTRGFAVAGSGVAPSSPISPTAPPTPLATRSPTPPALAETPRPPSDAGVDLHSVNWMEQVVPGQACFWPRQIKLHDGKALIPDAKRGHPDPPSGTGPKYDGLTIWPTLVIYGDIEGNGHDDAFIGLDCNNNGGTADGALLYSYAVFSGRTGRVSLLGLVTPQKQAPDELPTLLKVSAVYPGSLTIEEAFYGAHDSTCCPSGKATTRWTYAPGRLQPAGTVVAANPH